MFFSKHKTGKIRDIRIIRDKKTGKSKGIAYVEFYESDAALRSMALSG
jgi:RNA-binding protein 39